MKLLNILHCILHYLFIITLYFITNCLSFFSFADQNSNKVSKFQSTERTEPFNVFLDDNHCQSNSCIKGDHINQTRSFLLYCHSNSCIKGDHINQTRSFLLYCQSNSCIKGDHINQTRSFLLYCHSTSCIKGDHINQTRSFLFTSD